MTADETNLAIELLRRIEAMVDEIRSDIRDIAASMARSIHTLERINGVPQGSGFSDVSL